MFRASRRLPRPAGSRLRSPGGSAEAEGLTAPAIVLELNGTPVVSPATFVGEARKLREGDTARLTIWKEGAPARIDVPVLAFPREASEEFEILYDVVESDAGRLRTILTRPKGAGPFPALYVVQGLGCFSMEGALPGQGLYNQVLYELTRRGYVTVRVDKPGMGDSEGGPCPEVDFETETVAYRAALASLDRYAFIDRNAIFLFGHSMGGVMAPLLVPGSPVRGVIVYGTGVKNWMEYELENTRKQMTLGGMDPAEVEERMLEFRRFLSVLYVEDRSLLDALAAGPGLREDFPDPPHLHAGKHYRYFQQINRTNLPRAWQEVEARVLTLWGESDFVSYPEDHAWIATIVTGKRPGNAEYRSLAATDHWFNRAESKEASMRQGPYGGAFNPEFTGLIHAWMDSVRGGS